MTNAQTITAGGTSGVSFLGSIGPTILAAVHWGLLACFAVAALMTFAVIVAFARKFAAQE